MIFNLAKGALDVGPSDPPPDFFCVADAGIERTPLEREGLAMVTRGAVDVITAKEDCEMVNETSSSLRGEIGCLRPHSTNLEQGGVSRRRC